MRLKLHELASLLLDEMRRLHPQLDLDGTRNVWILKPSYGSKGKGIQLVHGANGLRQVSKLTGAARIAQKYVERPLLLSGKKFDIRLYVLICGWEPSKVYLYEHMLLKVCSESFSLSPNGLNDKLRHLTNCAVQHKDGMSAEAAEELLWSSERFGKWLGENGYGEGAWEEQLLPSLSAVARATVASAHGDGASQASRAR